MVKERNRRVQELQQLKLKHQHEVQKLKNQIDRLEQKNISLERKLAEAEGGYFSSFFKISTTMSAEKADAIFESASKYRADVEHAMNSTLDEVFFPLPPRRGEGPLPATKIFQFCQFLPTILQKICYFTFST